ncbi:membrane protein [Actinokineospora inagensis]|uniref:membrane protein n=1 Tax=Actinokineospora inagensis TaxID=103730 RepID=UPI0004005E00|nr:membrane protein [Actinokineospora inagensis]
MLLTGAETRVVELRVHGVMGTSPANLVGAVAAVDVAGDGVGRIVRPADRLLRPAPGPVLRAEGRSVPRVVEGYVWGAMTSGGLAKATWALLFPFSLVNMAHWMLPPVPPGHRPARLLGAVNRSLLRLAALLLTGLLVAQAAVVSLDLVAGQCLAPGGGCLTWVPDWLRGTTSFRQVVGLSPVFAAIFVLHRVSTIAWETPAAPNPPESQPNLKVELPGRNLVSDPDTPALRALHLTAALALVALLPLGGPFTPPSTGLARVVWSAALTIVGACALCVLLLDDPRGAEPSTAGRRFRAALGPLPRVVMLLVGVALAITSGVIANPLPVHLAGTGPTVEAIAAGLIAIVALLGLLLIPAALIARRTWAGRPRDLRPWAGGWMAAPVLTIGSLLGGGLGAGLAISLRKLVGSTGIALPAGYEQVTLLWGAAAVIGLAVSIPFGVVAGIRLLLVPTGYVEVGLLHKDRFADAAKALRAWRMAGWQRRNAHRVLLALAGVLAAGTIISVTTRIAELHPPRWMDPLPTLGILTLGALVVTLVRAVYTAAQEAKVGRRLGVIADLASFWPREAHPTVPPCYALKVAPELAARVVEHLKDPNTRVVLTGHSQGSLLVAVTAARLMESLNEPERQRIGLVTVGSQLQWAYPRAFPAAVPHESLAELAQRLGTRWRSLCRGTDPLGGAVTTWNRQICDGQLLGTGFRPDGTIGPLPAATPSPTGALVLGGDHWLPDPMRGPFPGRRWIAGVLRHSEYTADPEWDRAVAMAAGLDPEEPRSTLPWPSRVP